MKYEYTNREIPRPSEVLGDTYATYYMGSRKSEGQHWGIRKAMENPGKFFESKGTENGYTYFCVYTYDADTKEFKVWGSGLGARCPSFVSHHIGDTCSACGQKD